MTLDPYRDAVALLLAELDGQAKRRSPLLLEPYVRAEDPMLALGLLVRGLLDTSRYLGTHFAGKSDGELREELETLAEGFALGS